MIGSFLAVSIVSFGYIGLPTAAIIASRKPNAIGVDLNKQTVDTIKKGNIHIIEPGLEIIVEAAVNQGFLRTSTKPEPADVF
jgi:UDP-N-acetyl-D-mannosaminuronic acid dehydrogenase